MKTVRMLVNTPASQGAIGDIYSEWVRQRLLPGCLPQQRHGFACK